jgi:uncharacterized protein
MDGRRNLLGGPLEPCAPKAGYRRDGFCRKSDSDPGTHVACSVVTDDFLDFTGARGNDLRTPSKDFPGLRAGDHWCLCAARWWEAQRAGAAPPLVPEATDASFRSFA